VRTKVGTNPAKLAYVCLCLQTGETRMKKTITGNTCIALANLDDDIHSQKPLHFLLLVVCGGTIVLTP
jgi:hypothetical protein